MSRQRRKPSCVMRLVHELSGKRSMFSLSEPNWNEIDVEQCFAPPKYTTLNGRILTTLLTAAVLLADYVSTDTGSRGVYWAYLTLWTYVISLCYLILALLVTVQRADYLKQPATLPIDEVLKYDHDATPNELLQVMWGLYGVASTSGVLVTWLYWCAVVPHHGVKNVASVYKHGILCLFILIDGHVFSTIPLRLKQIMITESYALLYLIWVLIFYYAGMGDGLLDAGDRLLDLKEKPTQTVLLIVLLFLVAIPAVFLLLWTLSHFTTRPLECDSEAGQRRINGMDEALHYRLPSDNRPLLGPSENEDPPLQQSIRLGSRLGGGLGPISEHDPPLLQAF